MFPELVDWFEDPLVTLRPYLAQPIRGEEYADDSRYLVKAELPGIDPPTNVEVTLGSGYLTIHAERSGKTEGKRRSVVRYGRRPTVGRPLPAGDRSCDPAERLRLLQQAGLVNELAGRYRRRTPG